MSGDFKFGIEEEYFLVDAETKSVSREMPHAFLEQVKSVTGGQAMGEMLQSQLEVATTPHHNIADARTELHVMRHSARRALTIEFPPPPRTLAREAEPGARLPTEAESASPAALPAFS